MESKIVSEWTAQAKAEGKNESLLQVLRRRFKEVPDELRDAIRAIKDVDRLTACIDLALDVRSLRAFRQKAGL